MSRGVLPPDAGEAEGFVDHAPPPRDRMTTAVFMVAILHAIVILGVTFGSPVAPRGDQAPSLEVIVVPDPIAEVRPNEDADYLAQVNQRGAGTDPDARAAESPRSAAAMPADGGVNATGTEAEGARADEGAPELVAVRADPAVARRFADATAVARAGNPLAWLPPAADVAGADEGDALRLKGRPERELLVTANTRESGVAVYLDGWRRRIERVGTMNYPLDAIRRDRRSGNPVLEVRLLADGRLGAVTLRRSSGVPELDAAAVGILKLAAPFDAFPAALAVRHDALRLTYEWQFMDGRLDGSTVRVSADTR